MSRYDEGVTDYVLKDMTEVVRMDSGTTMVENNINSSLFLVNISHCPMATLEELEGLEQVKSHKDQGSLIHEGNRPPPAPRGVLSIHFGNCIGLD